MDRSELTDREYMKRIIAMLFSFAVMAEHVATRSYFVRCYMLWILRGAEAYGRRCVTGQEGPHSARWVIHRNSRSDALQLAGSFRLLAHALQEELRQEERFASWWNRREDAADLEPDPAPSTRALSRQIRSILPTLYSPALELKACRVLPPP